MDIGFDTQNLFISESRATAIMAVKTLLVTAFLGMAHAQSTSVVSLIVPFVDKQSLVASVRSVDATATEYLVQCPPDTDSSDCGLGTAGVIIKEGPSTIEFSYSDSTVGAISGASFAAT